MFSLKREAQGSSASGYKTIPGSVAGSKQVEYTSARLIRQYHQCQCVFTGCWLLVIRTWHKLNKYSITPDSRQQISLKWAMAQPTPAEPNQPRDGWACTELWPRARSVEEWFYPLRKELEMVVVEWLESFQRGPFFFSFFLVPPTDPLFAAPLPHLSPGARSQLRRTPGGEPKVAKASAGGCFGVQAEGGVWHLQPSRQALSIQLRGWWEGHSGWEGWGGARDVPCNKRESCSWGSVGGRLSVNLGLPFILCACACSVLSVVSDALQPYGL